MLSGPRVLQVRRPAQADAEQRAAYLAFLGISLLPAAPPPLPTAAVLIASGSPFLMVTVSGRLNSAGNVEAAVGAEREPFQQARGLEPTTTLTMESVHQS